MSSRNIVKGMLYIVRMMITLISVTSFVKEKYLESKTKNKYQWWLRMLILVKKKYF